MGTGIRVVSRGEGVVTQIRRMEARAAHPQVGYERIATVMRRMYAKQFATQGAFMGTPWKPLKPSYAKWKLANGYGRRILVQSGAMKDSFTKKSSDHNLKKIGDRWAEYGSTSKLAIFHQRGTHSHKTGKQILPPRVIAKKTPEVVEEVKRAMVKYIVGRQAEFGPEL